MHPVIIIIFISNLPPLEAALIFIYINVKIPKNFVWANRNKTKIYFNLKDLTIINDF